jgi:hypothetical protein
VDSRHFAGLEQPLASRNLGDEIDLDLDFGLTNLWSMAIMFAANVPGGAAQQLSGGNRTWVQPALWSNWSF